MSTPPMIHIIMSLTCGVGTRLLRALQDIQDAMPHAINRPATYANPYQRMPNPSPPNRNAYGSREWR